MHHHFLAAALSALSLTGSASAGLVRRDASSFPKNTCPKTNYYKSWKDIKHAFIFGDSYTTTGFNYTGVQPTPVNPLGNPTYPGYTAANGPNWVDFLTVQYNASILETYNLAYGGATVDSSLVAPYLPTVSSVAEQVENEFFPTYASKQAPAWSSSDTLFGVFIGINDVGNSYGRGLPATALLNENIFAVYEGLMQMLYNTGARNFLFINVPPVDRSPLSTANPASSQAEEKADIAAFNADIITMAHSFKSQHPAINIFTVNSNSLFNEVLDRPASFPQTSIYKNTTGYCPAYANGTPAEDTFYPNCTVPVNEYFWLNSLHPTYPMQNVLAQAVSQQLTAGPNVC